MPLPLRAGPSPHYVQLIHRCDTHPLRTEITPARTTPRALRTRVFRSPSTRRTAPSSSCDAALGTTYPTRAHLLHRTAHPRCDPNQPRRIPSSCECFVSDRWPLPPPLTRARRRGSICHLCLCRPRPTHSSHVHTASSSPRCITKRTHAAPLPSALQGLCNHRHGRARWSPGS